jgi:hypothetical protein
MRKVSLVFVFVACSVAFAFSAPGDLQVQNDFIFTSNYIQHFSKDTYLGSNGVIVMPDRVKSSGLAIPAIFNLHNAPNGHRSAAFSPHVGFPWILLLLLPFSIFIGMLLGNIFLATRNKMAGLNRAAACVLAPQMPAAGAPVTLKQRVLDVVFGIPEGVYFDTNTVIEKLRLEHGVACPASMNSEASAARYMSKINSILNCESDIAQKAGNSYSKGIYQSYGECNLFLRITR